MFTDCNECGCIPCVCNNTLALEHQVIELESALNSLLESVKLCRDCNVHLDSLNTAIEQAEALLGEGNE